MDKIVQTSQASREYQEQQDRQNRQDQRERQNQQNQQEKQDKKPPLRCPVKAVIFDMDGTLVDTEKYYRIFWPKALAAYGYHMTDEQALSLRSLGRPFAPARLREWFGEELDYAAVRQKRKELMAEYLEHEKLECKPGAIELLDFLQEKGITKAIATATEPVRAQEYLARTGLTGYFDKVISATQVKEGKPSPDIYLYACKELGLAPEECMAVEDAPNGVLSAYRAGCKVVMVPDQTEPDEELSECLYQCVPSLDQIRDILCAGQS